ncbi:MAG: hypothetical protein CL424_10610 [Acidimicrobiaceae bacterium]|nr:hypothetical protein [Acidimicrobiaceae bacterium]
MFIKKIITNKIVAAPVLVGAIAATAALGGVAGASTPSFGSPEIGMEVLDMMCVEQGGQAYTTPFTISRCQNARTRPGFEIETLVCEGLLGGTFHSGPSTGRAKRTTWICSPGAI